MVSIANQKKKSSKQPYIIAVAGKGGTGKTTLSALVVNELVRREWGPVLAIDADPNANLHELLGFELEGTIGELQANVIQDKDDIKPGITKKRWIEYNLQQILHEGSGKDLLAMGRGEGPSCYCAINNILREYLTGLAGNYNFVVMDNEAGMEHLSRRTTSGVDALLIISDTNPVAIKSAVRISNLVDELGIDVDERYLVLNRVSGRLPEKTSEEVNNLDLPLLAEVPRDEEILELCLNEQPISQLNSKSPAAEKIKQLVKQITTKSTSN